MKTKFTKNDLVDDTMVAYDYHLRKNTKRSKGFKLKQYWLNKDDVLAVFEGLKKEVNEQAEWNDNGDFILITILENILNSAIEELKVKK